MQLLPYPGRGHPPIGIDVTIGRTGPTALAIRYVLTGALDAVAMAGGSVPVRADGLWRATCFEAFVLGGGGQEYLEFNFAPSGAWAAYRFGTYRDGMVDADMPEPPRIGVHRSGGEIVIAVDVEQARLAGALRVGLSAVIASADGTLSYWALAHPAAKPDFHDARAWVAQVAA